MPIHCVFVERACFASPHPLAWTCVQRCTGQVSTSEVDPQDAPPRNRRQEETFRKVLAAGMETLREKSYADLTVRTVAARAKVAPATAYTYFSSKNHLIAEVYLDLVRQVPYFTDVNDPMPTRVEEGVAPPGAGGRRRTRGRRRLHDGVARRRRRPRGTRRARPDRRGDPPPHHVGHRPRRRRRHRVGARDGLLRRAGAGRQRGIHLSRDRRPAGRRGAAHPDRSRKCHSESEQ